MSPRSALRPPLAIISGPAGSGKTYAAFESFLAGGDRALLIVPSTEQAENCAGRLATLSGRPLTELRPRVTTFTGLVAEINNTAPDQDRRPCPRALQRLALVDLMPKVIHDGDFLAPMRGAPGFIPALAERIREWKLACIRPIDLERGATAAGERGESDFAQKLGELAKLFHYYETFLAQNRLCDGEDELLRAIHVVKEARGPLPRSANRILVDGFYRFTRAQRRLLAAIASRGVATGEPEAAVAATIPYEAGRGLLFGAPDRTLRTLREEFEVAERALSARLEARSPVLAALERCVFTPAPGSETLLPAGNAPRIRIFDAPNPYVEIEMVAREFRRLHDRERIPWDNFAVILRSLGDYVQILSAVFERYGVPLQVEGPEVVGENPLIATVLSLLAVIQNGWQRDDVLQFLKSSYTAPDKLAADGMRRRAMACGVRETRDRWLELINRPEENGALAETVREMARVDGLLSGAHEEAEYFASVVWSIVADFGLEERIALGEPGRQARDKEALAAAKEILSALAAMARMLRRGPIPFETFRAELAAAWLGGSCSPSLKSGMVRVVEPYDSRRFPIRIAAVMGLTERIFPRRVTEDPFLRDDERAALRAGGGIDLDPQRDRADDERLFFYQAVTAPSERLILTYPRSSDESDTLPSFYLDEVRAALPEVAFETLPRTLADVAPQPDEAVSQGDMLLAGCADLFNPGFESAPDLRSHKMRAARDLLADCLAENGAETRAVLESRWLPRLPALDDESLKRAFGRQARVFSVSELETYSRCPFQYLMRHALGLMPEEENAGMRLQGTILHSVLRRYFRWLARSGALENGAWPPQTDGEDSGPVAAMRRRLRTLLEKALASRPIDATPHRRQMMERLLSDALDRFAARELRFAAIFGFVPAFFELSFGINPSGGHPEVDDDDRGAEIGADGAVREPVYDPASRPQPLLLRAFDDGPPVAICGVIDRVDLADDRERVIALDYKLGKPADWPEIQRGASLQLPLYLLAIERVFGLKGAVACYDAMHETGRRRIQRRDLVNGPQFGPVFPLDDPPKVAWLTRDQFADLTVTAESAAVRAVRGMGEGQIEARPGPHCTFCAYGDVCRTTPFGGHDGGAPRPN